MHFYRGDTWNDLPNDGMSLPAYGGAPHGYIIEFALKAGDIDGDENVDIADFNAPSACMNGPSLRAYPITSAARSVLYAQAKCSMAV